MPEPNLRRRSANQGAEGPIIKERKHQSRSWGPSQALGAEVPMKEQKAPIIKEQNPQSRS